jgi:hypothetical protein
MAYPATPKTWVAGDVLTAAQLNAELRDALLAAFPLGVDAWTSYAPALTASTTNPTLGSGSTVFGKYNRIGRTIIGRAKVIFGTSGTAAGTGLYRISLPVAPAAQSSTGMCAYGMLWDNSASDISISVGYIPANTANQWIEMQVETNPVQATTPWAWAASDSLEFQFTYEAAA